jgi:hypothetical protein
MIELERDESGDFPGQVWHDANFSHVIVLETEDTVRFDGDGPGWYVRDEVREMGPFNTFEQALYAADDVWREVTLAPANRLARNLAEEDENDGMQYLTEYLAEYGAVGIDAQALANLVLTRLEDA